METNVMPTTTGATSDHRINGHKNEHEIEDTYNFHDSSFRRDYQLNYHDSAHDYEYYAPAYRFGFECAERHEGMDWDAVQQKLQSEWQTQTMTAQWADIVDVVRYGWMEARDPDALRVHHQKEYSTYRDGFRTHYNETLEAEVPFEQFEPAYQRGYEVAVDPSHRSHMWEEMEPEILRYYEEEYADGRLSWEHYRSAAYHAWHDVRAMGV